MAAVTLEQVRADASPDLYPRHLLPGCESALVLFAAAFHGLQDAVWMAEAGLRTTCVDVDAKKLDEMSTFYPEDWDFVTGDVFEYVSRTNDRWDIVSVDCPSNLFAQCAAFAPVWCLLARKAVVLGCSRDSFATPPGWRVTEHRYRSSFKGGTYWAVIEPVRA